VGGVQAGVGDQDALQAVQDDEEGLAIQGLQQLPLGLEQRHALHLFPGPPADVGQGAGDEILEAGVALVQAPPQPPGQGRHFQWSHLVEPLPGQGALAHAADGDHVEDARLIDVRTGPGHPVGEQVQLAPAADQLARLEQGLGVGDVGLGRGGDVADVFSWCSCRSRAVLLIMTVSLGSVMGAAPRDGVLG
jgi:hypothetical protein